MTSPEEVETVQMRAPPMKHLRKVIGRLARVPAALAALLAVVVVIGITWALLVPPWQAPDENTHFGYAQSLAERLALPGDTHRAPSSTDQNLADAAVGADRLAFHSLEVRPDWSAKDYAVYLAATRHDPARSNGGGPNPASSNPPLYYLYGGLAYWATYGSNAFGRLYAMRLWGVGLLLLTVIGAWLLAGEVLERRRIIQLAAAAAVGLFPMEAFISTSVSPDALMVPLWTFALWLGARVIIRAAQPRDAVSLCALTAAAILTKGTSYALVPAVLLALLIGWHTAPGDERRKRSRTLAVGLLTLAAPVLAWIGLSQALGRSALNTIHTPAGSEGRPFNVREFLSYLWQYYLPRLPFMTPFRTTDSLPAYAIWVRQGWGLFGWLDVATPAWLYSVLAIFTGAAGVTAAALVARVRDRTQVELVAFFAVAVLALLFGLHLTEYRSIIAGAGAVLQGRYLLPVIGLFGLAVGLILSRLPVLWRGPVCGALLAGFLVLQVVALSTIARTYYT